MSLFRSKPPRLDRNAIMERRGVEDDRRSDEDARRTGEDQRRANEDQRRADEDARRTREDAARAPGTAILPSELTVRAREDAARAQENAKRDQENARRTREDAKRAQENEKRDEEDPILSAQNDDEEESDGFPWGKVLLAAAILVALGIAWNNRDELMAMWNGDDETATADNDGDNTPVDPNAPIPVYPVANAVIPDHNGNMVIEIDVSGINTANEEEIIRLRNVGLNSAGAVIYPSGTQIDLRDLQKVGHSRKAHRVLKSEKTTAECVTEAMGSCKPPVATASNN